MRKTVSLLAGLGLAVVLALPAAGQVPGPGRVRPGVRPAMAAPRAPGAEFLLAASGPLKLSDQQVTRLAAVARRTAERREALRTRFESLRPQATPGARPDSAARQARAARAGELAQALRQEREQTHADLRDALAVLTPDQLANAWEMIARRGMRAGRPGLRAGAAAFRMRNGAMQRMRQPRPGMVPSPAPGAPQP